MAISGPIYEVTLSIDREVIDEFDQWLAHHVEQMLDLPGFVEAQVFEVEDDDQGRARRVTHYLLDSEAALELYLAGPAAEMRQAGVERFGERLGTERRVLHGTEITGGGLQSVELCLNCGTTLGGQYCGNCGQRARSRLISIWELLREAFGDLFELDSRLWRTLIPLLVRPGQLTRDYLEGRRVRFMPPFRTYLVLSIVFFLIAFFDPREELGLLFEPQAPAETEQQDEDAPTAQEIREEVLEELADEGIIAQDVVPESESVPEEAGEDVDGPRVRVELDDSDTDCEIDDIESADIPDWMRSRMTPERLMAICERIVADDGRAFLNKLLDNVPAALFILLPLMALALKLLYPLSKRYYVEHLLFVVHFHAFVFLILILQVLLSRLGPLVFIPETVVAIFMFAASLYIPVYLYKAMRKVYTQGHLVTIFKYSTLMVAYFAGLTVIFLFAALFAAFSI